MASTYLTRTPASTGNRKTFTFSAWVKKCNIQDHYVNLLVAGDSASQVSVLRINPNQYGASLELLDYNSNADTQCVTNAKLRDANGWYHVVLKYNTTEATSSDRLKIYINGQEQSLSTATYPSLNYQSYINLNTKTHKIGQSAGGSEYGDFVLAHVHFIDGTAYDSDTFGETDSTTGIWKPKTAPSVTYGTNGFFLKFENSGAFGTDSSGNSNTFTVNGTMTQTIDTPSNVFATMNPLNNYYQNSTFSHGNTTVATGSTQRCPNTGTFGFSKGKWYWEIKGISGTDNAYVGITSNQVTNDGVSTSNALGRNSNEYSYVATGNYLTNDVSSSYGATYTDGDIIGIAVDCDNNKLYFSKNGVWQNSGDPTSGATGTGAISITAPSSTSLGNYFPAFSDWWTLSLTISSNFGNGYFGTTQVASAGTSTSGDVSIWEYDCPDGYYGLNTKNINSQEYD